MLKNQANIIYNIINEVDNKSMMDQNEVENIYQVKNQYMWKQKGGERILNNIDCDSSD